MTKYALVDRVLAVLTLLVGAFAGFMGFTFIVGSGKGAAGALFGLAACGLGASIIAGVLLAARAPRAAAGLVIAGTLSMAVLTYWMWPVSVPLALVVITGAALRSRAASRVALSATAASA